MCALTHWKLIQDVVSKTELTELHFTKSKMEFSPIVFTNTNHPVRFVTHKSDPVPPIEAEFVRD